MTDLLPLISCSAWCVRQDPVGVDELGPELVRFLRRVLQRWHCSGKVWTSPQHTNPRQRAVLQHEPESPAPRGDPRGVFHFHRKGITCLSHSFNSIMVNFMVIAHFILQILLAFIQNSGYIRAGVCFPKSCSSEDLVKIVNACKYWENAQSNTWFFPLYPSYIIHKM